MSRPLRIEFPRALYHITSRNQAIGRPPDDLSFFTTSSVDPRRVQISVEVTQHENRKRKEVPLGFLIQWVSLDPLKNLGYVQGGKTKILLFINKSMKLFLKTGLRTTYRHNSNR